MSQPPYPSYPPQGDPYGLHYQQRPMGPPPKSYLVEAILVTIFCCMPFGIVAIVYAAMAKSAFDQGNWELGQSHASTAKMWSWLSFGLGLGISLIYFFVVILAEFA